MKTVFKRSAVIILSVIVTLLYGCGSVKSSSEADETVTGIDEAAGSESIEDTESGTVADSTDSWYIREADLPDYDFTVMRAVPAFGEIVFDTYNISADGEKDAKNGSISDYYAIEVAFGDDDGDTGYANAFSGFSKTGEYRDEEPVSCAVSMSADYIDIGDHHYTDGKYTRIDYIPEPLNELEMMRKTLKGGIRTELNGEWYTNAGPDQMYELSFGSDGSFMLADKHNGEPIEVYKGFYSYEEDGVISCITARLGYGTMPVEMKLYLKSVNAEILTINGDCLNNETFNFGHEHDFGNTSMTDVFGTESDNTSTDISEARSVKEQVNAIESLYNDFQKNSGSYMEEDGGSDTARYVDDNEMIRCIVADPGAYPEAPADLQSVKAYYYYTFDKPERGSEYPYFVYLEDGKKQYRFYLNKKGNVIRMIDDLGNIQDYNDAEGIEASGVNNDHSYFADMAKMEIAWVYEGLQ